MELYVSNNNGIFIDINSDRYIEHHSNIYIEKSEKLPTKAYDVDLRHKRLNIIGVLGEFFEREILINANYIKEKQLLAYNLLTKDIKYVDTNSLIFENNFVDSCGMASHTISNDVIWSSFKEFFERQCLMTSYLSESKGIKINILNDSYLKKYDDYIKNYVDIIDYFDISLCNVLHVIIAIGLGDYHNAVGLGTDTVVSKATKKAQKEILQYFATERSKYDQKVLETSNNHEYMDIYHTQFKNMSKSYIYKEYEYLYIKSNTIKIENIVDNYRENKLKYMLEYINKKLNMSPYIVVIPSFRNIPHLKIVKTFDENWFPHMNINLFEENVYLRVSKHIKMELHRNKKVLPFA